MTAQNGNLVINLWQDTKAISCASTNTSPGDKEVIKRKNKDGTHISIPCPNSIVEYNKHMGGVDHNDQIRGYYSVRMKSRKYYKYLFWAAFDVTLSNMYIISKQFPDIGHKNVKEFQMSMGTLLIGEYNSRKRRGRPSLQPLTRKFCTSHFPSKAIKKGNRCHYCYNTLKKEEKQCGVVKTVTSTYATPEKQMTASVYTILPRDQTILIIN